VIELLRQPREWVQKNSPSGRLHPAPPPPARVAQRLSTRAALRRAGADGRGVITTRPRVEQRARRRPPTRAGARGRRGRAGFTANDRQKQSKRRGGRLADESGRQAGRVQQRMERTLRALTSTVKADAPGALRSFPIPWWLAHDPPPRRGNNLINCCREPFCFDKFCNSLSGGRTSPPSSEYKEHPG
jgi:hypothetical protein